MSANLELLVSRPADATPGSDPDRRVDWPRPELKLLQGGRARPKRLGPPTAPPPGAERPSDAPSRIMLPEVPIYLRPIPSWLPRLW
ncbi:MAG TPA: hypothetical protein VGW35_10010 [Methylomirabilota bacterium]|jgi:hypothetical protein|nr:hypothetical protein [Methylomirabilota bacterium]